MVPCSLLENLPVRLSYRCIPSFVLLSSDNVYKPVRHPGQCGSVVLVALKLSITSSRHANSSLASITL